MTSLRMTRALVAATAVGAVTGLTATAVAAPVPQPKTTTLTIRAVNAPDKGDHYKATIAGKLRSHQKPVSDETVTLNERKNGVKAWTPTGDSATTDSNGKVTFTLTQTTATEQYQLVFAGDTTYKHSKSGTITVRRTKS